MKLNMKFQGVGGIKPKNHPWGRYGYFLEIITQCKSNLVFGNKACVVVVVYYIHFKIAHVLGTKDANLPHSGSLCLHFAAYNELL